MTGAADGLSLDGDRTSVEVDIRKYSTAMLSGPLEVARIFI